MPVRKPENPLFFEQNTPVKVTTMGNIIELQMMQKKNFGCSILNIDKDHYIDLKTGELKEKKHIENRGESAVSMRATLKRIRELVNTNVTDPSKCLWCTFTYAQEDKTPMTDLKRLYGDYKRFWTRFKRYCDKMGYPEPDYLAVAEPQGNTSWHLHTFFVWNEKAPFIPNDADTLKRMKFVPDGTKTMADLWEQGFTSTKSLNDCDNIGAYFSAYLGDMPLDEVEALPESERHKAVSCASTIELKKFVDERGTVKEKKFLKGGRLYLYPPGMNIVRKSKGIKDPEVEMMTQKNAQKKVSAATETFSCEFEILDDDGVVINAISKRYYNTKRQKKQ